MARRVMRIAPWQAGKVSAVMYFIFGLVFAVPFALFGLAGQGGIGFAIALPIAYAVGGLIFVPLCCLLYNFVAKLVGGLEFDVVDHDTHPA